MDSSSSKTNTDGKGSPMKIEYVEVPKDEFLQRISDLTQSSIENFVDDFIAQTKVSETDNKELLEECKENYDRIMKGVVDLNMQVLKYNINMSGIFKLPTCIPIDDDVIAQYTKEKDEQVEKELCEIKEKQRRYHHLQQKLEELKVLNSLADEILNTVEN